MCRVLILDDDQFFGETVKLILEDAGEAQAEVVMTEAEAIQLVIQAIEKGKPYDVFLVDQRLGSGKDGIDVYKDLRSLSPDSDCIIFTGYEDTENGLRAYEAGVFRYLSKPFENKELLFLLKSLKQWRQEQDEHNWQKIFNEMMEAAIREKDFNAVGKAVVKSSLRLGFKRAHLFWTPTGVDANLDHRMLGIASAGEEPIDQFAGHLYPLDEWLDGNQFQNSHETIFLKQETIEKARDSMEKSGYLPPIDEIAFLPLWSGLRFLGVLMLDHAQKSTTLNSHERTMLNFFTNQISLALEHAVLYTKELKTAEENQAISKIGQEINAGATNKSLAQILEEVRTKISGFVEVVNFLIFLVNPEINVLDFYVCYRNNQPEKRPAQSIRWGLEGYIISEQKSLLLSSDIQAFCDQNGIELVGEVASSWLGIPLKVSGNVIGGIVTQRFQDTRSFLKRDEQLLISIAEHVAGAIQNCLSAELEREDIHKLNLLARASVDLLEVARADEDHLWKAALMIATANFGLGFNRALLFLLNEAGDQLVCKTGIGTDDPLKAEADWELDLERGYTFDDFLHGLREKDLRSTDFEALIDQIEIPLQPQNAITAVIHSGTIAIVEADKIWDELPPELTGKISLCRCAILPLRGGDLPFGFVLVDNKHTGKPFSDKELKRLQTVLNYAGLVWETLRERKKSEKLLEIHDDLLGKAGHESLKTTLENICTTIQSFCETDWVWVCPFKETQEDEFDLNNVCFSGILKAPVVNFPHGKPTKKGITSYLINHEELILEDTEIADQWIGIKQLEASEFISREGIRAFIGIRLNDAYTGHPLGILYLDYRSPRQFKDLDLQHARAFASLAAFAISNARRMDEQKMQQRLEAALETAEIIGSSLEQERMLRNVLEKLRVFFRETSLCVLTYDPIHTSLKFAPETLKFYKITNPVYKTIREFPLKADSIACKVAQRAIQTGWMEKQYEPEVQTCPEYLSLIVEMQSELCISLMSSEKKLLGVLVMERSQKHGFDENDIALVETVARQLSLGLERFQQSEQVSFNKTVSTLTAWAADLAHELNNEVGNIQNWAYLIKEFAEDNLTISDYATQIEESARKLYDAGLWNEKGRIDLPLDLSLQKYAEPIARQQSLQLDLLLGAENVYIKINLSQFQRVLRHLIRNASRAMGAKKHKKIVIRTARMDSENVEIQIEDFGHGVSEKVRPFLLKTNVTTKGRGGYGFLITRQIIEEIQGSINLLPREPGKGAVFSIKLPIAKPENSGDE